MQSPAVMFIESAADSLAQNLTGQSPSAWIRESQQKELTSFGDVRAQKLGATGLSDDFRKGYELGLQTARAIIAGSSALVMKGVKPEDVL